jgi:formylglycine-generating enzyme required for sulfatase activity
MWDGFDEKSAKRVIRGGYWYDYGAEGCTVAIRRNFIPGYRSNGIGFRVALSSVP